jgi:tripartite-type tricarboxylate transporter receptor subunit TctC
VAGSGLHEVIGHIRTGKMRNLAIFTKKPITLKDGTVLRPITDFLPELAPYAPFGSEYTLGVKRDTPVDVLEKIKEAFVAASDSPEFNALLKKKFFFKAVTTGEEADRLSSLREAVTCWLFWDMKVEGAKVNPADLGIPRPEDFDKWWPPKGYEPRLK